MKQVFKFIFNVIRNLSLIIVIGLICLLMYFSTDKKARNELFQSIEKERNNALEQERLDDNEDEFGTMAIEEPALDLYKSKKFKIEIKGGFAYLRPSQIMYINSGDPSVLVTIQETKVETKMKLYKLDELLNNSNADHFFRIRTAIINCKYVQQLVQKNTSPNDSYSYQHFVIMEDGEKISISKPKATELFKVLDNLAF